MGYDLRADYGLNSRQYHVIWEGLVTHRKEPAFLFQRILGKS